MTAKLFVESFNADRMYSVCRVIESDEPGFNVGRELWVDLTVDAGFGEMPEKDLVGKTVVVTSFQPIEFIGVGVSLWREQQ